jgi:uncharacterized RDD family membrane protein YckC
VTEYGGFWRRVWARTIDAIVLLPLLAINYWFWAESRWLIVVAALPLALVTPAYLVIFHVLRGQSFGKIVLGLKVQSIEGSALSWTRAIVRFIPVTAFQVVWAIGVITSALAISEDAFQTASLMEVSRLIRQGTPAWVRLCTHLYMLWVLADAIVLVNSSRKRAIHDLMAGTVVIQMSKQPAT